ncbi:MAG: hypothetical protein FWE13_00915 [Firmicutes bacterium]|nr:hypothetical protein [Bacillota bacterium]
MIALKNLDDKIKEDILNIFSGFSNCTTTKYYETCKCQPLRWMVEFKQKLLEDVEYFKELSLSDNEEISDMAKEIVSDLCD